MVMKEPQIKRIRIVGVRFTSEEFQKLYDKSRHSTTPQLSEFIRRCVFDKPIVIKHRNQSLDEFMAVLMELKKELNFIGHNFNQSVRLLNTFKDNASANDFIRQYEADRENIFNKVDHIEARIHQIADVWLQ
jgi:hypothetical protein